MKYLVDIDGILCENGAHSLYAKAKPIQNNIDILKKLYRAGHEIVIYTSRLSSDKEVTEDWLARQGVLYHKILFDKPTADFYIDDKAVPFIEPNFVDRGE